MPYDKKNPMRKAAELKRKEKEAAEQRRKEEEARLKEQQQAQERRRVEEARRRAQQQAEERRRAEEEQRKAEQQAEERRRAEEAQRKAEQQAEERRRAEEARLREEESRIEAEVSTMGDEDTRSGILRSEFLREQRSREAQGRPEATDPPPSSPSPSTSESDAATVDPSTLEGQGASLPGGESQTQQTSANTPPQAQNRRHGLTWHNFWGQVIRQYSNRGRGPLFDVFLDCAAARAYALGVTAKNVDVDPFRHVIDATVKSLLGGMTIEINGEHASFRERISRNIEGDKSRMGQAIIDIFNNDSLSQSQKWKSIADMINHTSAYPPFNRQVLFNELQLQYVSYQDMVKDLLKSLIDLEVVGHERSVQTLESDDESYDQLKKILIAYTEMKRSSDPNYEKTVDDFIDPVTLDFFKTPVVASNGRTYELDTLQGRRKQCLNHIDVCRDPLTREPLDRLARYDADLVDEMNEAITWYNEARPSSHASQGPG